MAATPSGNQSLRPFVATITILLVVAAAYEARAAVVPIVVAALLAFLLTPLVCWLQHWRVPRVAGAILATVLVVAFCGGVVAVVVVQLRELAKELPKHRDSIIAKAESVHRLFASSGNSDLSEVINEAIQKIAPPPEGTSEPTPSRIPEPTATSIWNSFVAWAFAPALEVGIDAGIIIVLVVFMLAQHEDLRNRIIRLSGTRYVTSTTKALGDATRRVRSFLFHQLLINCAFGLIVVVGLWIIGVPYPWLWGVLGAALRYVPYVGTWLASICPILLSIAFTDSWTQPLLTVGLFAVLDLAITNILEPIVYGRSVGVSGPALLAAAVFWAWLWGPVGLLLATPLTACLVVLSRNVGNLGFLHVLLGDEPALSPPQSLHQRLLARDEDESTQLVEDYIQKNGVEKVYDNMLVPVLVHTKETLSPEAIAPDERDYILNATRQLLEQVVFPEQDAVRAAQGAVDEAARAALPLVLGCPARDDMDETALRMLERLLPRNKCRVEVLSPKALAAEVLTRVGETHPAVVVIGAVAPCSSAAVRYFCKRLRLQYSDVKILVGCWGLHEIVKQAIGAMRSAGADLASAELLESRELLLPLLRDAALTHTVPPVQAAEPVAV